VWRGQLDATLLSVDMVQASAASSNWPTEKTLAAEGQLAAPGSPGSPDSPGFVNGLWRGKHLFNASGREGITGDQSGVEDLQNQYHMHEVHFAGIRGNPVVVALSLAVTWSVVLAAVLEPNSFFDNAADAKRWERASGLCSPAPCMCLQ